MTRHLSDSEQRAMAAALRASATDQANAEVERLRVQLAGCGVAANDGSEEQEAAVGTFGWSPAYADVLCLRRRYDDVSAERDELKRQLARLSEVAVGRLNRIVLLEDALLDLIAHSVSLAEVIQAARRALNPGEPS